MSDSTKLKVIRPLCIRGERVEADTTLRLSPLAAAEVLASGRAELVHLADAAQCQQAVRADIKAAQRKSGDAQERPPAGWPWRPA